MKTNVKYYFCAFGLKQKAERPRDSGDALFGSSKLIFERPKTPKQHVMFFFNQLEKNVLEIKAAGVQELFIQTCERTLWQTKLVLLPIIRRRCPASSAASSALQRKRPRCSYLTFSAQFAEKLLILKLAPLVRDDAGHLLTFRPLKSFFSSLKLRARTRQFCRARLVFLSRTSASLRFE